MAPVYPGDVAYAIDDAKLEASLLPADAGLLPRQPEPMDCFTC
jgi:hypothetical protein